MLTAVHTWTLTAIAAVAGLALLWAFGRFSDQQRIQLAKRKLRAHLYAFRLFADEPALIFRAQKQLLIWNARYMGLMLKPAVVVLIPTAALLLFLDGVYGRRPLEPGETAIVTAQADSGTLEGRGVVVETPALRLPDEHRVMWRVRVTGAGSVILHAPGGAIEKRVECGAGLRYLSEWHSRLAVDYPAAEVSIFGFGMHWLVWFLIVSSVVMLALRKRFGVTF
jgi:hypothetical protein